MSDARERDGDRLEPPGISSTRTVSLVPAGTAGESLGPYRLLEKVGEGGMGEVWRAEQKAPVRRQVAVKVIKAGMDTKQVITRFEAERQALALMDHPCIAKVFEAGATQRGLPYFAMEYVAGEAITTYCDRQKLTTRKRLELFMEVCGGVQHAHQKGVIHRDLKPSNVLVTIQDELPVPKIIDFGVAKATAQKLTEKTMYTELGVLIGTPEYMSPEQAEMTGLDVDTRTDVYALGVMLYELLTGALPFDSKELRSASFDELRRRIREEEPPRPSTKVKTLGEQSGEVARRRQTEPAKLVGRLKGDLDWIVMKSLEKDRTRRYESPSELAADIERHLTHQPVLASPPSAWYRSGKFVRRHRFGVSAAAIAIIGLVGFAVTTAVQAARIARERDRANRGAEVSKRVSEFMTGLFEVSDPSEARGNSVTAREILDKGAEKIDKELKDSPIIQAQMMYTMGRVYQGLGLFKRSEQLLGRSVEVRKRILGPDHPDTLLSMQWWGWMIFKLGRAAEAEKVLREALAGQQRALGFENADTARSISSVGAICFLSGRLDEAEKLLNQAFEIRGRVLGPEHYETLTSMTALVGLYAHMKSRKAESIGREALEISRRVYGPDHPATIEAMAGLSNAYWNLKQYDEASRLAREALEIQRRVQGPEHPATLLTMLRLANVLFSQGHLQEAEAMDREVVEIRRRVLGPEHPDTLSSMNNLSDDLLSEHRYEGAEKILLQALAPTRRVFGQRHSQLGLLLYNLACASAGLGRKAQALDWLRQAIEAGYDNNDDVAHDPNLNALRGDPEFARLVAAIEGHK
jgi:eukaryotic-like serine/threonine-protein kinase